MDERGEARRRDAVIVLGADRRIVDVSEGSARVLGYRTDELLGEHSGRLIHPDDRTRASDSLHLFTDIGRRSTGRYLRIRLGDGGYVLRECLLVDVTGDERFPGGSLLVVRERPAVERVQEFATELSALTEELSNGGDLDGILQDLATLTAVYLHPGTVAIARRRSDRSVRVLTSDPLPRTIEDVLCGHLTGAPGGIRLTTMPGLHIVDPSTTEPEWSALRATTEAAGAPTTWLVPITDPADASLCGVVSVHFHGTGAPDEAEQWVLRRAAGMAGLAIDRWARTEELHHRSLHDDVTGLPKRGLMIDRIDQALVRGRRRRTRTAVLVANLDRFRLVNEGLGHSVGDKVLAEAARRIEGALEHLGTVGRLGSDEYLVLCEDVEDEVQAHAAAEAIRGALRTPLFIGGHRLELRASVGIALTRPNRAGRASAEELLRQAGAAARRVKRDGVHRPVIYDPEVDGRLSARLDVERRLRAAIGHDELVLHYQPVVDLRTAGIVGVEALVRWSPPGSSLLLPGEFIPVAEDTELISAVGRWVMERACRTAAGWRGDAARWRVSVNVSARQLLPDADGSDLADVVEEVLGATGLEPGRLVLEVTETSLLTDPEAAAAALTRVHELGVVVAIDDFGTGYATLDVVRRFPMAGFIKIDRSFVDGLDHGRREEGAIVAASIALAHGLGMQVVAEGVETEVERLRLVELDCRYGQGHLFARALAEEDLLALAAAGTASITPAPGVPRGRRAQENEAT